MDWRGWQMGCHCGSCNIWSEGNLTNGLHSQSSNVELRFLLITGWCHKLCSRTSSHWNRAIGAYRWQYPGQSQEHGNLRQPNSCHLNNCQVIHFQQDNERKGSIYHMLVNTVDTDIVGTETIEVEDDASSWRPGDKVVVASTDYDWEQAETLEVVSVDGKW